MRRRLLVSYLALTAVILALLEVPLGAVYARNERDSLTSVARRDAAVLAAVASESLEQILDNLLANAVEASPPGHRIEVGVTDGGAAVTVHVRDHGPGLSEQERLRAFDRFWQSGATPTGTSGLGLAIVRQLATANGGTITLEAPPGGGLDAVLRLPGAERA